MDGPRPPRHQLPSWSWVRWFARPALPIATPVHREFCSWQQAGQPPWSGPAAKGQTYAGTDRQCRGRMLQVVRDATDSRAARLHRSGLGRHAQRTRALDSLSHDELIEEVVTPEAAPTNCPSG